MLQLELELNTQLIYRLPLVLWGQCKIHSLSLVTIRLIRIMGMTRNVGSRRRLLELEAVVAAMITARWLSCSPPPLLLVNVLLELDQFQCQ
jgi:hypothetical protein